MQYIIHCQLMICNKYINIDRSKNDVRYLECFRKVYKANKMFIYINTNDKSKSDSFMDLITNGTKCNNDGL